MTWAEAAEKYATAAGDALAAGDKVAFIALTVEAAKCMQIARNLERADRYLKKAGKAP